MDCVGDTVEKLQDTIKYLDALLLSRGFDCRRKLPHTTVATHMVVRTAFLANSYNDTPLFLESNNELL